MPENNIYTKTTATFGSKEYELTPEIETLFGDTENIDLSICATAWNKQVDLGMSMINSSTESIYTGIIPTVAPTDYNIVKRYVSNHSPYDALAYNYQFSPAKPSDKIGMYPCLVSGSSNATTGTIYYDDWNFYNRTSNAKFFTGFNFNEVVCICPTITGWQKNNITGAAATIPWDDFISAPDNYYVNNTDLPNVCYVWNGTSFVQSSASAGINNIRPAYIFNSTWYKGVSYIGILPTSAEFEILNFKSSNTKNLTAGDVPAGVNVSANANSDGLHTRMPWGKCTTNNTFGNTYCATLIDYTPIKSSINWGLLPHASGDIPASTDTVFQVEEITTDQYYCELSHKYNYSNTSATRYGYSSIKTAAKIYYSGKLYHDLLAGLGMYFVKSSTALTGLTPETVFNSSEVYLGAMNANGYTVQQFITGTDLQNYTGYNKTGSWNGAGFNPNKPLDKEDMFDDIPITMNANGQSFLKWYAMTGTALTNLLAWFGSEDIPAGFNPMDRIVGVMQAPVSVPSISSCGSAVNISFGYHSGTLVECPLAQGQPLLNQGSSSVLHLGGYTIPQGNSYLDYEPYTKIDLYIPYCGTVSLPPSVFRGASLKVEFIYDIFTGECSGLVYRNGTFYTSIGGNFTSMQAVSSENVGAIKQAVVNGCMSVIGGAVATIGGVATGNGLAVAGGALAMAGSAVKTTEQLNAISPEMRGNSGGRCNFYKPNCCVLYMTEPKPDDIETYSKHYGRPVEKTLTLSSGMGFTRCISPRINGTMTETERIEIERMLETGVIL